jgi:hypothetical protein
LLLAGCSRAGGRDSRALLELERLAFVPPARCYLEFQSRFSDCSLDRALVFDRFELTRADLAHYWPGRPRRARQLSWSEGLALDDAEHAEWPALVDFHEAQELAALRGMRLPRPLEWIHVAVGRRGFVVPWGGREGPLWANTRELGLGSPWRVGTFENGRSQPFGCYDLLGNVWEWVDGIVPGSDPLPEHEQALDLELDDGAGTMSSILGGAYDTPTRATFFRDRFHARKVDKRTLSPSIGTRMCADARQYLWDRAPLWGKDAAARERVLKVARAWCADALARESLRQLLRELRARPAAPAQLAWLEQGAL